MKTTSMFSNIHETFVIRINTSQAPTMSKQQLLTPHKSFFKTNHSSTTPHQLLVHPCSRFTNPIQQTIPLSPIIYTVAHFRCTNNVSSYQKKLLQPKCSSTMPLPPLPPATTYFWGETPEVEFYKSQGVKNSKLYYEKPNGKIFTQSWTPIDENAPIKGVVFMTHGYGSDTSWCFQKICIEYAKWGYAVFAADLLGHGRSDGLHGYLGDMDKVAATSLSYFLSVRKSETYCKLPAFLFGESMGGLITMLMYFQSEPDTWTGLIFSAPLFVIPENMVPSKLHLTMYGLLFGFADTWAAMPDNKMVGKAIRDPEKLKVILVNPKRYAGKPRVGTMREVVRVTNYVQNNFHKVKAPFLTLHGTSDGVTCPTGSQMLYEKASSEDKSLKLYEGMYHSLIQGEPDDAANLVLADMKAWIDERVEKYGPKTNGLGK